MHLDMCYLSGSPTCTPGGSGEYIEVSKYVNARCLDLFCPRGVSNGRFGRAPQQNLGKSSPLDGLQSPRLTTHTTKVASSPCIKTKETAPKAVKPVSYAPSSGLP